MFNGCRADELTLHCQRGQVLTAHISRATLGWGAQLTSPRCRLGASLGPGACGTHGVSSPRGRRREQGEMVEVVEVPGVRVRVIGVGDSKATPNRQEVTLK